MDILCVCVCVCECVFKVLVLPTDSGNGTGSTNSSRPQSQIINDTHTATPSNNDSPQIKPSSDRTAKDVRLLNEVPEKKCEVPPSENSEGTDVLHNCSAKEKQSDTVDGKTNDTASDTHTVNNITSDTVGNTATSDTIKDTTSDTAKDNTSDKETAQSKVVSKDTAMDTISDVTEDRVPDKAWTNSGKQNAEGEKVSEEKKHETNAIDKLNWNNDMEEVDDDDVFTAQLPNLRKKSQLTPGSPLLSPSMSLGLSALGGSSPSMSPRPGRRSSFVSCYML